MGFLKIDKCLFIKQRWMKRNYPVFYAVVLLMRKRNMFILKYIENPSFSPSFGWIANKSHELYKPSQIYIFLNISQNNILIIMYSPQSLKSVVFGFSTGFSPFTVLINLKTQTLQYALNIIEIARQCHHFRVFFLIFSPKNINQFYFTLMT